MSSMIQRIALVWSMSGLVFAQSYSDDPRLKTLPTRVNVALKRHPELQVYNSTAPIIIMGDFDGDNKPDYVVRVFDNKDRKGLFFIVSTIKHEYIMGCGNNDDIMSDWSFDEWCLFRHWQPILLGPNALAPQPKGDFLSLSWSGKGGGIICWDKGKFVWHQQGE